MKWTMKPYGEGRYTIEDGVMGFDIHPIYSGSKAGEVKVSPEQSTEYAHKILDALNKCEVSIDEMDTTRVPDTRG